MAARIAENHTKPGPDDGAPASGERLRRGLTLEQRRAQRRDDLTSAALELFGTKGYASTSIDELCRTAFVSTRNFYEEFDGREAVLAAVITRIDDDLRRALGMAFANLGDHSVDRLRAGVETVVRLLMEDEAKARIVLVEASAPTQDQVRWRREQRNLLVHHLIDLLATDNLDRKTARRRATAAPTTPDAALAAAGAISELMIAQLGSEQRRGLDALVERCVRAVTLLAPL